MPRYFENFHISVKGKCENTFRMSVSRLSAADTTNIKTFRETNKHSVKDIALTTK